MTGPSSTPRGDHVATPGARWETVLTSAETIVADDTWDDDLPTANRAARRAAARPRRGQRKARK
ncbi:hypothetical protein [Streptomyces marianii]|uniref:Uncharacterized protein n=1 Tax=Streptomyces marianii TaxID=1817406 RepID=A0A5R9DUH3_9ACTN|nr:hypothetical protein [Streptomyces marianii]TLQ39388.1 hypothetical protein FEF34_39090 [Streptomyces marianii]